VKNRFQNLPFKCNLQRYTVARVARVKEKQRLLDQQFLGGAVQVEFS
jgi:hypothetical protein